MVPCSLKKRFCSSSITLPTTPEYSTIKLATELRPDLPLWFAESDPQTAGPGPNSVAGRLPWASRTRNEFRRNEYDHNMQLTNDDAVCNSMKLKLPHAFCVLNSTAEVISWTNTVQIAKILQWSWSSTEPSDHFRATLWVPDMKVYSVRQTLALFKLLREFATHKKKGFPNMMYTADDKNEQMHDFLITNTWLLQ